jgi:hypothetical protein
MRGPYVSSRGKGGVPVWGECRGGLRAALAASRNGAPGLFYIFFAQNHFSFSVFEIKGFVLQQNCINLNHFKFAKFAKWGRGFLN